MSEQQPFDRPMVYRIRIKAHLDSQWSSWFEDLTITRELNGETLLCGLVVDQASLHGLLKKVRDLGLGLISVDRVACESEQTDTQCGEHVDLCIRCPRQNTAVIKHNRETEEDAA